MSMMMSMFVTLVIDYFPLWFRYASDLRVSAWERENYQN